jgi:hypothetical protein
VTWTPTDRRPDDHEFVAFPYLDRLVDDGVPCADAFDLAPHDERVADSPHGAVALGSGVFRRGCFARNLRWLSDRRPALVGASATPLVSLPPRSVPTGLPPIGMMSAGAARARTFSSARRRRLRCRVLQQCLHHAPETSSPEQQRRAPAELDQARSPRPRPG